MKTLKFIEFHARITKTMKIKLFNARLTKIRKFLEFNTRINKTMEVNYYTAESQKNEILRIPIQNYENHENSIILRQNH